MSQSKAAAAQKIAQLQEKNADLQQQLVRLLRYVRDVQAKHDDIRFPELPDTYSEGLWRAVG